MSNPIVTENQNIGTTAWQWTPNKIDGSKIAAYTDKLSYNPGDTVTFYVSVQVGSTAWTGGIFRLGWYQGTGGRLMASIPQQTGVAQGYWDGTTLNNCPTAFSDSTTHLLEAGWASSYTWVVPGNAVTGVYLVQFTDANGWQSFCSFVVKGNRPADYAYIRPVTTDCAYNNWGGWSLYTNPTVGVKASFNRPDANGGGTGGLLQIEIPGIKWLERQGYNLSYLTMVDVHENPTWLQSYNAVLSAGHNEYWTKEIRNAFETAIATGVGMAFLGANASYWQCRLENDHAGTTVDRTVTCYKVTTAAANLSLDPQYGVDTTRVTSRWRDAVLGRPENTMVGIMFSNLILNDVRVPITIDPSTTSPYVAGTGLVVGQSYGSDVVGYEYDKQQAGGPANLQLIATTSVIDANSQADTHNMTTYVASSGALVFATGSINFVNCLDMYRWSFQSTPYFDPKLQALMSNIMTGLIANKQPIPAKVFGAFAMHQ